MFMSSVLLHVVSFHFIGFSCVCFFFKAFLQLFDDILHRSLCIACVLLLLYKQQGEKKSLALRYYLLIPFKCVGFCGSVQSQRGNNPPHYIIIEFLFRFRTHSWKLDVKFLNVQTNCKGKYAKKQTILWNKKQMCFFFFVFTFVNVALVKVVLYSKIYCVAKEAITWQLIGIRFDLENHYIPGKSQCLNHFALNARDFWHIWKLIRFAFHIKYQIESISFHHRLFLPFYGMKIIELMNKLHNFVLFKIRNFSLDIVYYAFRGA